MATGEQSNATARAILEIRRLRDRVAALEERDRSPLAVIGIGCRFPGARGPAALWRLLLEGRDLIDEVPAERWDSELYYDPDPDRAGKTYARAGGFLSEVDRFDAAFFGLPPPEAAATDPQQRLLLEVVWEALEHAAIPPSRLRGSQTGVFLGVAGNDYQLLLARAARYELLDAYSSTGNAHSVASGRISYLLGLEGPSLSIDTACSSSLVAVHLACRSLRDGESRLALAGGVNLILSPWNTIAFSKTRMLSPDGLCRTFDAAANGYVRGEGCGVVVLKRLRDALEDGDRVLALIRGSAANQDGRSSALTAPSGRAQQAVIRAALANAGVEPSAVGYVEAHGTGTSLGDPIEVEALAAAYGPGRGPDRRLAVGSIKTNFGHTETAAGIAGLIKVVLALQHGAIPPHLHLRRLNPAIGAELPLTVPTALTPWPASDGARRLAAVSSFGFSGTNVHVVLEEASTASRPADPASPLLLPLSARTPEALEALVRQEAAALAESSASLGEIARTLGAGRDHFEHRLVLLAADRDEAASRLAAFARGEPGEIASGRCDPRARPEVVFLFTGQGSQTVGMGRALYQAQPVFREALDRCAELLREELERPLLEVLWGGPGCEGLLDQTGYTQPALFALGYALARTWESFGVRPRAVLGHSVGEYTAACVAGLFSLEDGLRLIARRARLMQGLPAGGAMAALGATVERVARAVAPRAHGLSIAAENAPRSTVVSGDAELVEEVIAELAAEGIKANRLPVSHAFHSPRMDPILEELERIAREVKLQTPRLRLISNLSGREAGDEIRDAAYWRRHLREPVRFAAGLRALCADRHPILVELGPAPVLLALGRQTLPEEPGPWLPSLRRGREEHAQLLETAGRLYLSGVDLEWSAVNRGPGLSPRPAELPSYPFQGQRHWLQGLPDAADSLEEWLHAPGWKELPTSPAPARQRVRGWLVLDEGGGEADPVAEALRGAGAEAVSGGLAAPLEREAARQLLARLPEPVGVLLLALGPTSGPPQATAEARLQSLLHLVKERAGREGSLVVVTRGAQAVLPEDRPLPEAAALWGLTRVIRLEHPELSPLLLDLDPAGGDPLAVLPWLEAEDGEWQLALRAGRRHGARLTRLSATPTRPAPVRPDRSYLLTGGLGGLGLEVAGWLAAEGARRLTLLGRRAPGPESATRLAALEAAGVELRIVAGDVTRLDDVERAIAEASRGAPLAGVIHAAGILDDGVLAQQTPERIAAVLAPKLAGAWNLHLATRELPLDLFVLFASQAGLLGSAGQAGYAAANAALDALAGLRQREGLPGLALDWGPWEGAGMAATGEPRLLERRQALGISSIPVRLGLRLLARALRLGVPEVAPLRVDWSRYLQATPSARALLSELALEHAAASTGSRRAELAALPASARAAELAALVQETAERLLGAAVEPDRPLMALGIDSLLAIELRGALGRALDGALPATLVFDHPTVEAIARFLEEQLFASQAARPLEAVAAEPAPRTGDRRIAVLGVGCRFPGGASSPEAYWRLISHGGVAVTEVPPDRWDADAIYHPEVESAGHSYSRWGAFLEGVDRFDPLCFGISPREAEEMDPQQRLLLEVSWEAMERAGIPPRRTSSVGVFVGIDKADWQRVQLRESGLAGAGAYMMTGIAPSVAAGRLSYVFGWTGPCMVVDTACSSALVAIHLAIQSLRDGACELAVAGGVNLILTPDCHVGFSRMGLLSRDGLCKTFDARADGITRGEGCGLLVLKRLPDALRDGDPVVAVLLGSAVGQDGTSSGLTAPSGPAQQAVIRQALRDAELAPLDLDYVEAHGTGTSLGDPIEAGALGAVFAGRAADRRLAVGSVKTNLGHVEAAAGAAGLIKVLLALQEETIPAHLHLERLSPHLGFEGLPLVIPTRPTPWPRGARTRRAGVTGIGFGGTSAHLVVEEAPRREAVERAAGRAEVVLLSAHTPAALRELAERLREQVGSSPGIDLHDVAYTSAVRRQRHPQRLAAVAASSDELAEGIGRQLRGDGSLDVFVGAGASPPGKIAFVCSGQGGQWLGMGRALLAEPAFAEALERCDRALSPLCGWSVRSELLAEPRASRLAEFDVVQLTIFSFQVAVASLLRAWGLVPDAIVGHSMGEVAAAHLAGALSLDDAATVIHQRSRLMKRTAGQGGMAVVGLPAAELEPLLERHQGALGLATVNSPASTVLSGEIGALHRLLAELAEERPEVFCREIKVDVAAHSPQMELLRPELRAALAGLSPGPTSIPLTSSVSGEPIAGEALAAGYWERNLRQPVRFLAAAESLLASGVRAFVELSPHPVLLGPLEEIFAHAGLPALAVATTRREEDERRALLRLLGRLEVEGFPIDWARLYPGGRVVELPPYPFQRRAYWLRERRSEPTSEGIGRAALAAAGEALRLHRPPEEASDAALDGLAAELCGETIRRLAPEPGLEPTLARWRRALERRSAEPRGAAAPAPLAELLRARASELAVGGEPADPLGRLGSDAVDRLLGDGIADARAGSLALRGLLRGLLAAIPETRRLRVLELGPGSALTASWLLPALAGRGSYRLGGVSPALLEEARRELDGREASLGLLDLDRSLEAQGIEAHGQDLILVQFRLQRARSLEPALRELRHAIAPGGLLLFRELGPLPLWLDLLLGAALRRHELGLDELRAALRAAGLSVLGTVPEEGSGPFLPLLLARAPFVDRVARRAFTVPLRPASSRLEASELAPVGGHPLLGHLLVSSTLHVFEARWSASSPWFWDHHRLFGEVVVPGAGHLDAALDAHAEIAGVGPVSLEGVEFRQPLVLRAGEERRVQVLLTPSASGGFAFQVQSRALEASGSEGWTPHALGELRRALPDAGTGAEPLDAVRSRCSRALSVEEYYRRFRELGLEYGSAFSLIAELWAGEGEALARLTLPADEPHSLFPGLLDSCFQLALAGRGELPGEEPFIPFAVEELVFLERPSAPCFCHYRLSDPVEPDDESFAGELTLYRGDGAVLTRIRGLHLKRARRATLATRRARAELEPILQRVEWRARPAPEERAGPRQRWLILADQAGLGARLAEALESRGHLATVALPGAPFGPDPAGRIRFDPRRPEDYPRLLGERGAKLDGVAHLLCLDATPGTSSTLESLASDQGLAIESVVALVQALTRGSGIAPRLLLVTAGAQAIDDGPSGLSQATLLGLARVIALEHPELRCRRVDLEPGALRADLPLLARELLDPDAEDELGFRRGERLARRLTRLPAPPTPALVLEPEPSYLITGGLGGLGLLTARWLVERGARRLLLLGRRPPGEAALAALAELREAGAAVEVLQADVASEAELRAALRRARSPLGGVIHAAGLLADSVIANLDRDRIARVLAPKLQGSWNLHRLTAGQPLRFFVLYASQAGLVGNPGQAAYAAANAFQDALAHHRRQQGLPALAIDWGPFAEIGLAAGLPAREGVSHLPPALGLLALEHLLGRESVQAGVAAVDWQRLAEGRVSPLLEELVSAEAPRAERSPAAETLARLSAASSSAEKLELLARLVGDRVSHLLGIAASEVDRSRPLMEMGLDSLMAVQLRNGLATALGRARPFPATLVFRHPTVDALARFVLSELEPAPPAPAAERAAASPPVGDDLEALLSEVEGLSDADAGREAGTAGDGSDEEDPR